MYSHAAGETLMESEGFEDSPDPIDRIMDEGGVPADRRDYVRTTIHGDDWGDT